MIYVSSSCVKAQKISESVKILADQGFQNIELSGGTELYPELVEDLKQLKSSYQLNLLAHNYFPPPPKAFVLNLASLDDEVAELSFNHCKTAIDLSKKIGADKYAFHAGFLINIPLNQIGKKISAKELFNKEKALIRFHQHLIELINHAGEDVKLYIENNVLSSENFNEFGQVNPFFFTDGLNLSEAEGETAIHYLLDLAHLRVSCNSLGLDYKAQLESLFDGTDYIHLSGNDGTADQNLGLDESSEIYQSLLGKDLSGKTITLETYTGLEELKYSYKLIEGLL